jgi:hypothetical protein
MRHLTAILFAAAIVGFAALGHHMVKPDVTYLPTTTVASDVCENHPYKHGAVLTVAQYGDDPATLHIECADGAWITADK